MCFCLQKSAMLIWLGHTSTSAMFLSMDSKTELRLSSFFNIEHTSCCMLDSVTIEQSCCSKIWCSSGNQRSILKPQFCQPYLILETAKCSTAGAALPAHQWLGLRFPSENHWKFPVPPAGCLVPQLLNSRFETKGAHLCLQWQTLKQWIFVQSGRGVQMSEWCKWFSCHRSSLEFGGC